MDRVPLWLTQEFLHDQLHVTCTAGGGKAVFGFDSTDIGIGKNRSIGAMGLFLMNHSSNMIMILGQWKSKAFVEYISPQVLEWTNNMSTNMTHNESFFDTSPSPTDRRHHQLNGGDA
jgi:hypothetical protein